jgi:hypothetical protein
MYAVRATRVQNAAIDCNYDNGNQYKVNVHVIEQNFSQHRNILASYGK